MYKMSALTSPQVGTAQKVVSSNLTSGVVVMPFIAEVAAGASGEIALLQTSAVNITGIDEIFTYTMDVSHSIAILNAFTITDTDIISSSLTDGSGANVELVQDDAGAHAGSKPGFKESLIRALQDASSTNVYEKIGQAEGTTFVVTPEQYLEIQSYKDTLRHLQYDTIANLLTASDLFSFNVVLDVSGGADNMWTEIGQSDARAVAYRKTLFTQISESRIEKYLAPSEGATDVSNSRLQTLEGVSVLNFLPLTRGDKMVFVFDATVGEAQDTATGLNVAPGDMPTSGAKLTRVTVDALPASGLANVNNAAGITTLSSADNLGNGISLTAPTKRRFAIEITLSADAPNAGKGFCIADPSAGNVIFDPAHGDYRLMIAAGLLPVNHGFVLTAEAAPLNTDAIYPSLATAASFNSLSAPATVYADVSGLDPSGGWDDASGSGFSEVEVIASLPNMTTGLAAPNRVGWLVVNGANNVNRFVYDANKNKVFYRARATAAADTATLYAVSNAGRLEPINGLSLAASAGVGPQ